LKFPLVPGHEIAGVVEFAGAEVTKFAVGDHIGIGCFVDSCLACEFCSLGDEQYCEKGNTMTYGHEVCAWTCLALLLLPDTHS
jgi:alcohol dehydrogenase (NADP+)